MRGPRNGEREREREREIDREGEKITFFQGLSQRLD